MPQLATGQDLLSKLFEDFDMATRREVSIASIWNRQHFRDVLASISVDGWLEFVDYLVYSLPPGTWHAQRRVDELNDILALAGSEFTVGERDGSRGLVKRVPEGVAGAVSAIIGSTSSAGLLLAEAWHAMFGRNPDPEEAYEKAIKAVEQAGVSVVAPKNSRATLGTMIADMSNQGGWDLPVETVGGSLAIGMARALWQGQESRHGGNGYRKPSQEEAETAVLLAVPLVQWFTSGTLSRRA
ncbi:hypothetical protein [Microbacterium gorillae]|uniref:hypothetical protein n=1 Tax=Microbacterium gorillae TaxID=1231063 RepID=UPI003D967094